MEKQLSFASLFCGCGGFDLGFLEAGFRCVAAWDNDPVAVENYRRNLDSPVLNWDLASGRLPEKSVSSPDVLLAGSPCQGFSTAGKREYHDPRNQLLLAAGKIALSLKPRVFVVENVAGAKSGKHRKYWDSLTQMLRLAGYRTFDIHCNAAEMGVPQIRRRLIMLAWKGREVECVLSRSPGGTLRSAIGKVQGVENHDPKHLAASGKLWQIANRIGPGQKLSNVRNGAQSVHTWDIPEVFGVTTRKERRLLESLIVLRRRDRRRDYGDADPVNASALSQALGVPVEKTLSQLQAKGFIRRVGKRFDLTHAFNGKFRRLEWERPSCTVDTKFGNPRHFLHPAENRGFTVREAARVQGFPDEFRFAGPLAAQFRMVGNAVPPPVAHAIAQYIKDALLW